MADEVLRPIAAQQVENRISQARAHLAQINLAKEQRAAGQPLTTPDPQMLYNKIVGLVDPSSVDTRGTELLRSFADVSVRKSREARKTEYHEVLAWLDRRREPLRIELTQRLVDQAIQTEKGFLVCVDGERRQYEKKTDGRFVRQADKPGGC